MKDADRYLKQRGRRFYYVRRVPMRFAAVDGRGTIREALKTTDIQVARAMRDARERADERMWAAGDGKDADLRYAVAIELAAELRLPYRETGEIVALETGRDIERRVAAIMPHGGADAPPALLDAALGGATRPDPTLHEALDLLRDTIEVASLSTKSPAQRKRWEQGKRRSLAMFIEATGVRHVRSVTRSDALAFHRALMRGVADRTTATDTARRRITDLRALHNAIMRHYQWPNDKPFADLPVKGPAGRTRPPFPTTWIVERFLKPGPLDAMDRDRHHAFLIIAETGVRPSELLNAAEGAIVLNHPIPHVTVAPQDARAIKTGTSARRVPLIGVALAVARRRGGRGFARFADREDAFSAAVNKHMRKSGLCPTSAHSVYSLRHSFEARMKAHGVGDELRQAILGHAIGRERYGYDDGYGDLVLFRDAIAGMALPFDPSIVR